MTETELSPRMRELRDVDICVTLDYTCDCPKNISDELHGQTCRPYAIYFLCTPDDREAGIFGKAYSPPFATRDELNSWVNNLSPATWAVMMGDDDAAWQHVLDVMCRNMAMRKLIRANALACL